MGHAEPITPQSIMIDNNVQKKTLDLIHLREPRLLTAARFIERHRARRSCLLR